MEQKHCVKGDSVNFRTAELIRAEYHNTDVRQVDLAKKYDCGQRAISEIVNNKRFLPKVQRPTPKDRYDMQLKMLIVWVRSEDVPTVMSYDKTRHKP